MYKSLIIIEPSVTNLIATTSHPLGDTAQILKTNMKQYVNKNCHGWPIIWI